MDTGLFHVLEILLQLSSFGELHPQSGSPCEFVLDDGGRGQAQENKEESVPHPGNYN